MAGRYVELTNPGYSSLFTRDLSYTNNPQVDGAADAFDPDSSAALHEGEWLEMVSGTFQRGGAAPANQAAGTVLQLALGNADPGSAPCFLNFQERGRYDAQVTRKAHCIVGPEGFELRTKMIICSAQDDGDRVFVVTGILPSGAVVRCLASATAIGLGNGLAQGTYHSVGIITQAHGQNDASVLTQPASITQA